MVLLNPQIGPRCQQVMKYKYLYLLWEVSDYGCDPRGNTSLPIQSFSHLQKNQTKEMIAAQRFEQLRFNAHIHF